MLLSNSLECASIFAIKGSRAVIGRLTEDQLMFVLIESESRHQDNTIELFKLHYVDGIAKNEACKRLGIQSSNAANRFADFEDRFHKVIAENNLQSMIVICKKKDVRKIRKLDVSSDLYFK